MVVFTVVNGKIIINGKKELCGLPMEIYMMEIGMMIIWWVKVKCFLKMEMNLPDYGQNKKHQINY